MKRSNAAAAALVAIVVVVGVLALRYRPVLPSSQRPVSTAQTQAATEPSYPPASIDGRPDLPGSRTVELCGYGPFEITPDRQHPPHLVAAADVALARANAAMVEAGAPHQRAAARYLQMTEASLRTYNGHLAQQPGCEDSPECRRRAGDASWSAFVRAREALIADALATRDPAAHALAYYACQKSSRDADDAAGGSCHRIGAARWAQVEPDNLMAWVHVAQEAQSRNDPAGRAEAMSRAAGATAARLHLDAVLAPLDHDYIRSLDAVTRSIAQIHAIGVRAAMPIPGLQVLVAACPARKPLDEAQRELCSALGRTLANHGQSLLELGLGVQLGERAGWPAAEVSALRERMDAYQRALIDADQQYWTCSFQRGMEQYISTVLAGGGELQAAETRVKASGRSAAELAQEWRRRSTVPLR